MTERLRIVVTGAKGFIGRNLCVRLTELGCADVLPITRANEPQGDELARADLVYHLAGVNRPKDISEFTKDNVQFTQRICDLAANATRPVPMVYASSVQATLHNPYGESKRAGEDVLTAYGRATGARVHILRLTNVFGKWSRPNYNSIIATVCHNIARGLPLPGGDPAAPLRLVYIDDVVETLLGLIGSNRASGFVDVHPVYETTLGEVIDIVRAFAGSRQSLVVPRAGSGLVRALHATYLSHLEPDSFAYEVPVHSDQRGEFVEMLKTEDSGQVSYFTARPGVARGEHYHHTKAEKFIVVRGTARFGFRNIDTGETFVTVARGGEARIVEIPPGWAHNVTNVGVDELICVIWANEAFDHARPDTFASRVAP